MIVTRITPKPLPPFDDPVTGGSIGAEIVFHGRVRDLEAGRKIIALDYEHYDGMTEIELEALATETATRFAINDLECIHRIGRVPVGEASVRIIVRSGHRPESLAALAWFIDELKRRVPLWKWGVTETGERFPSNAGREG